MILTLATTASIVIHVRVLARFQQPTPSPPTKSFPAKSPRVELSGRLPIELYGQENSHPLELRVCLSQTSETQTLSRRTGRTNTERRQLILLIHPCDGCDNTHNMIDITKTPKPVPTHTSTVDIINYMFASIIFLKQI